MKSLLVSATIDMVHCLMCKLPRMRSNSCSPSNSQSNSQSQSGSSSRSRSYSKELEFAEAHARSCYATSEYRTIIMRKRELSRLGMFVYRRTLDRFWNCPKWLIQLLARKIISMVPDSTQRIDAIIERELKHRDKAYVIPVLRAMRDECRHKRKHRHRPDSCRKLWGRLILRLICHIPGGPTLIFSLLLCRTRYSKLNHRRMKASRKRKGSNGSSNTAVPSIPFSPRLIRCD